MAQRIGRNSYLVEEGAQSCVLMRQHDGVPSPAEAWGAEGPWYLRTLPAFQGPDRRNMGASGVLMNVGPGLLIRLVTNGP